MTGTSPQWVMDTSAFTHFWRAGHADLLERLAPAGIILIPFEVDVEVSRGDEFGYDLPGIDDVAWVERTFLNQDEMKLFGGHLAALPAGKNVRADANVGESAVLACAGNRDLIAVLDDGDARRRAQALGIEATATLNILALAYMTIKEFGADELDQAFVDLVATKMRLPKLDSCYTALLELGKIMPKSS